MEPERRWRGEDREEGRKRQRENIGPLMKHLDLSPGTPLAGCRSLVELLNPSELFFLHLLNGDDKLNKTVALELELEKASESPGGLVQTQILRPHPPPKILTQEV